MEKVVKQYFQKNSKYLQQAKPDLDSFYNGIKKFFGDIDYDIFTSIITDELYPFVKPDILSHMSYIPEFFMKNNDHVYEIEIPPTIKEWGNGAFWDCTSLSRIIFNNTSLTYIGDGAFHNCNSLDDIEIPSNIKVISKGAFEDCYSLTTIKFNEGLESIDNYAFDGCKNLTEFTLPKSIIYFGYKALPSGPKITVSVYHNTEGEKWATDNNCKINYLD